MTESTRYIIFCFVYYLWTKQPPSWIKKKTAALPPFRIPFFYYKHLQRGATRLLALLLSVFSPTLPILIFPAILFYVQLQTTEICMITHFLRQWLLLFLLIFVSFIFLFVCLYIYNSKRPFFFSIRDLLTEK